jgi:hypothetical protein
VTGRAKSGRRCISRVKLGKERPFVYGWVDGDARLWQKPGVW